jgi:hypothetical protein
LAVSGLGTMMRTTGHVFPLILHSSPSKSDGHRPTLEGLLVLLIFAKPKIVGFAHFSQSRKSAFKTQHICHTH